MIQRIEEKGSGSSWPFYTTLTYPDPAKKNGSGKGLFRGGDNYSEQRKWKEKGNKKAKGKS